jgi:hypothetical protein
MAEDPVGKSPHEPFRDADQRRETRRWLRFAVFTSLALTIVGVVTHGGPPKFDSTDPFVYTSDAANYVSMVGHRWIEPPGEYRAWSIHGVPVPFRYRVLVPWLASRLPFDPVLSLSLVNYVSLGAAYAFLLLTCRRLGMSRPASALGLAIAFTFYSHITTYSNPLLTDGFILLVLSAMTYAFVVDSFWMFAAWGLAGTFAREVPLALLPVWSVRDVKRGAIITAIAGTAMVAIRISLMGPSGATGELLHPSWWLNAAMHVILEGPPGATFWPRPLSWSFVRDIAYCWGWAFAFTPLGLLLLPRDAFVKFVPFAAALCAAALGMSFVATDVPREFLVLMPVVVVAAAQLTDRLAAEKRVVWLALLLGLAAVQFSLSEPNLVLSRETWRAVTVRVPLVKIGAAWTIGAAILLRHELGSWFSEKRNRLSAD